MPVHKPPVRVVQAKLVQLKQTAPAQKAPRVAEKTPKVVDLTQKKREAEAKAERERQARLKAERRKKEAEERELAEKKAAERKAQQAAEEEARKQQSLAEELNRMEQERIQKQLQQEVAAAEAAEKAALAEQQAAETAQSYVAVIAQRVEQFWSRPPSARKGMKCELLIQLVPTGRVVNVTVSSSSGNAAFDRSAEQAVLKAEQFRELQNLPPEVFEQYFRQLKLVFNPTDLRL
ncbi:cell envelope integrity protein TolA [Halioxenophilus sp. WMMB6]|uniref:cell envelope integrity protein TolA n=1 Tax=Halioxenophilus sp. WMMB6 TaxID=3073815 RepID=UPI00295F1024|nr:cell envelope integrity protein TolA [Halioxenophilus sp. WMMB6]